MELHDILLKWLNTFDLKAPHGSIGSITDGVAMAEALNLISPEWFTEEWLLSKIKTDTMGSWRLKVSNLKKILEKTIDYYQECFSQNLSNFRKPDVMKIGEQEDPVETGRMLQLILGCAVNCNNKQEYIGQIMAMDESEQRAMMECIQELDSGVGALSFSASLSIEPHVEQLLAQLSAVNLAKEQMAQKCMELDLQVSLLQEEKASILDEKKRLMEQMQSNMDSGSGTLRRQVEGLKEELFKLETSRDDYRLKVDIQEKELTELQVRVEELQKAATEARQLKDELDILRETADKVDKYEATLQSYKKKLEESGDMKRELKLLEAKNLNYIQQNMELEEEVKRLGVWKAQVDVYKKEISVLHEKLNEETKRADKLQYEVKTTHDKLASVQREKERLIVERDSLRETNEELKCLQLQASGSEGGLLNEAGLESVSEGLVSSNTELRQKIVRLQHENNMLRLANKNPEENSDSLSIVQSRLDDAKQEISRLWQENREAYQRIIQLEGELKEISERGEEGVCNVRTKLMEMQQQYLREKQRMAAEVEEREQTVNETKQIISLLQEKLNQKELELQEAEDKQKKYVEKAKSVVKAMDPSLNLSNQEVSILRNQLAESQKEVKELQKELERKNEEEKLMSSAFHNLAQSKHREALDERLASLGHGQSFLARQRQPTTRKINAYNSK